MVEDSIFDEERGEDDAFGNVDDFADNVAHLVQLNDSQEGRLVEVASGGTLWVCIWIYRYCTTIL
jgi:hypothetical protein